VVVVANPANTNALILSNYAPKIPKENVTCLTRLDHNRALGQVSEKTGAPVSEVKNVIIWGNHSSTQYPDVNHGEVSGMPIRSAIGDDAYLDGEFVKTVQQRGAAIIAARKLSSALSAASSVCDHVRDWVNGTAPGTWTSMGVVSPGGDDAYGIEEGLMYSFPVTCANGRWSIVPGLKIDDRSRGLMDATAAELKEEKAMAEELIAAM
jgi:malate dehydrogenase